MIFCPFQKSFTDVIDELKLEGGPTAASITNVAILIVIIGTIIMVIAGIGCLGASKNSKCLLGVVSYGPRRPYVISNT